MLPKHAMDRCSIQDARKMTNDLMEAVFTTDEIRLHSVTSNSSKAAKPPLPEDKVFAIIDMSLMYLFYVYIFL